MLIIAHRGNDGINKENSKEAIINSLAKYYIDGVEFDIRLTKDKEFILNHDPFYNNLLIKNTSSKALKKQGLNTLEEVLNIVDNKKILLIEVKEDSRKIKAVAQRLNKALKRYDLNIYICSFNYDFIKYFKENYGYKCGLIISKHINQNHIINNFDFNSISYKCKEENMKEETFIWTVNNPKYIRNNNVITDKPKLIYDYIKNI